jgi:2-dehydro-3-deoxyglucarate aldolase
MVNSKLHSEAILDLLKFSPEGKRSFGVNRAHGYGSNFGSYVANWNKSSVYIAQIETKESVANIAEILSSPHLDGVMIGPYDMSGSLGVPGETAHPLVQEAEKTVIAACKSVGKSCGTQLADFSEENIQKAIAKGYTFIIASSDLFVLNSWAEAAEKLVRKYSNAQ